MKPLSELATEHETDKGPLGHNYTKFYEMFFEPLRNEPVNLMEIGIDKGGSLRMWEEYFPHGDIHGVDIKDCKQYRTKRIFTHICDQSKAQDLMILGNRYSQYFDIIIDDGSHVSGDMVKSFDILFRHLKPGGFYIIEDILWDYKNSEVMALIKILVGDVNLNGKVQLNADKGKTVPLCADDLGFDYMERNIEWIFNSCGMCMIKKIC